MSTTWLGHQGGDRRNSGDVKLDLSTCVNPYGPPERVMAVIRSLSASIVRAHPYEAATAVEQSYAEYLSQPIEEFIAGRGTSELIWILAREMQNSKVGLPLPTYSEFRRAFTGAQTYGGGPSTHPVEVINEAMSNSDLVILSNPHNPTGQIIDRQALVDIAMNHPSATLVVDESYIDFLSNGGDVTLIGCEIENVIVLRSPSKFYGLAGIRSGVAWSRRSMRHQVEAWRTPWPVSALAAEALNQALNEEEWAVEARGLLASDGVWLEDVLRKSDLKLNVAPGLLHFRLATGSASYVARFANTLQEQGILVRVLADGHGVGAPGLRIAAPCQMDRRVLTDVLDGRA